MLSKSAIDPPFKTFLHRYVRYVFTYIFSKGLRFVIVIIFRFVISAVHGKLRSGRFDKDNPGNPYNPDSNGDN